MTNPPLPGGATTLTVNPQWSTTLSSEKRTTKDFTTGATHSGYAKAAKKEFPDAHKYDDDWDAKTHVPVIAGVPNTAVCENLHPLTTHRAIQNDRPVLGANTQLFGFSALKYNYGYWASVLGWQWHEGRNFFDLGESHAISYVVYLPTLTNAVFSIVEKFLVPLGTPLNENDSAEDLGKLAINSCKNAVLANKNLYITCLEVFNVLCTDTGALDIYFIPMTDARFQNAPTHTIYEVLVGQENVNNDFGRGPVPLAGPADKTQWAGECAAYKTELAKDTAWLSKINPWIDASSRSLWYDINHCVPHPIDDNVLLERLLDFAQANTARGTKLKHHWIGYSTVKNTF